MDTKKCTRCGEEKPLNKFPYLQNKTALSMREAAQMANQAFPILSPEFWNTGADKRVCEELGL